MNQPNESSSTDELIESCARYLHDRFDYRTRMAEVAEELSMNPEALDAALAAFMLDSGLLLRVMIENAAKRVCEWSARKLIRAHGGAWQEFYERDDFEW